MLWGKKLKAVAINMVTDDTFAWFCLWINQTQSPSSKVIAFGYGYGGNLAAWARKTHPTIFNGAVASSAPVNATFDFQQYFQKLEGVLAELDK